MFFKCLSITIKEFKLKKLQKKINKLINESTKLSKEILGIYLKKK